MVYEQWAATGSTVTQIEAPIPSGTFYRTTGEYVYSLSDHLGNVRAVVPRGFNPASLQATLNRFKYFSDYYPFGWAQPGRDQGLYRYGYQGQEKDPETNWYAFQLCMYDGRIGRWMTTDPKNQYASPYLGLGNNPVNGTDPDGGMWIPDEGGGGNEPCNCITQYKTNHSEQIWSYIKFQSNLNIGVASYGPVNGVGVGLLAGIACGTENSLSVGIQQFLPGNDDELINNLDGSSTTASQRLDAGVMTLSFAVTGLETSIIKTANLRGVVQRVMSEAELIATQETGLLKGGRTTYPHFVTNAASNNINKAVRRLAIPSRPAYRVTLEEPADALRTFTKAEKLRLEGGRYLKGGGMEMKLYGEIPVTILRYSKMK